MAQDWNWPWNWGSSPQKPQSQSQSQSQSQTFVQNQDVAMRQVMMEQMEDCFEMIKRYLDQVSRVGDLKKNGKATKQETTSLEMSNFAMAQSVNLLQISLDDCFKKKKQDYIQMAQSRVALFKTELDEILQNAEDENKEEIKKRLFPIYNNLVRIVEGKKVPLNPPPKLTEQTFNEKTVGDQFGTIMSAGHQIRDKMEEVRQNPSKFHKEQENMIKGAKDDMRNMQSFKTEYLEDNEMMQDIDPENVNKNFADEDEDEDQDEDEDVVMSDHKPNLVDVDPNNKNKKSHDHDHCNHNSDHKPNLVDVDSNDKNKKSSKQGHYNHDSKKKKSQCNQDE